MAIHIGCSGWHYLPWRGDFYPEKAKPKEFLKLYMNYFDTVELNNSFYRLPTENAVHTWRDAAATPFKFSVKANRFITHSKKLKDTAEYFSLFFDRVKLLGDKLGPILFQLPPGWSYDVDRLEEFLASLPEGIDMVFEFRNPSWIREEMFALLRKYHIGYCIHDMPNTHSPDVVTSNMTYIRFHGIGGKYTGNYSDEILDQWATKLVNWTKDNIHAFVYFNNDIGGFAPRNALTLKKLVNEKLANFPSSIANS